MKWKLKKGDEVEVVAGNNKGSRGKIIKFFPESQRVTVQGVHFVKKHQKATRDNPKGGIVQKEASIHMSNVMLVCSQTGKPTRVGKKRSDSGEHLRYSKKSGKVLE